MNYGSLIRGLAVSSLTYAAFAQTPAGFVASGVSGVQYWDGHSLYTKNDLSPRSVEVRTQNKKTFSFLIPNGALIAGVKDGEVHAVRRNNEKGCTEFLHSNDFKHWDTEAFFSDKYARLLDIQHLKGRKYLLVRGFFPFIKGDKASFFAIARSNDQGKLEIEDLVDLGLDLWDRNPPLKDEEEMRFTPKPGKENLVFELSLSRLTRFPGGFALVLRSSGRIYVFNNDTGELRWSELLYPSAEAKEYRNRAKDSAILGVRPTRDGHLLVCSRTEDAVLNARSIFEGAKIPPEGITQETHAAFQVAVRNANDKALEAFPEILWWDFDPESAHFVKLSPPQGMPTKLYKSSTFEAFNFIMDMNGQPILSN